MRPGGGPGRCPPLVYIGAAYVKAQPGGGEWRAGRGSGKARLPELPTCVCAAPAGARGGQLPGRGRGKGPECHCTLRGPRAGEMEEGGWRGEWVGATEERRTCTAAVSGASHPALLLEGRRRR